VKSQCRSARPPLLSLDVRLVEIALVVDEADDKSRGASGLACPYCGRRMQRGYFLIGGGVVFAESTVAFGPVFASKADIEGMLDTEETNRPHVIVGGKGYHLDPKNWPKPGMFCPDCLAIVVKVRN
jgi:hypothetical protein